MSFRTDQRGQAIQVGAVLLFAVLIVAFSSYQAVIIPEDNRRVEFNHNQEVQEHLAELRSAVLGAADSRSVRSVTVALGTTYPSRTLGLNPGPPGGSLRTVGTEDPMVNLTIDNATVDGETGDFWNGTQRTYDTGAITYEPIYNRYDEAPTTAYEHSVLYNRFPSSNTLVLANQSLLDGDRLSITTVDGSLDRTSSRSTSVDVRPVSSGGGGVLLEEQGSSSPIVLEFDSQLSASRWERILSDQDNVVAVSERPSSTDSEFDRIHVELATGVDYRLGMTKAAVGQGATGGGPAYLTDIAGDGATVQRGSSHDLTLAVRDRYNNPVAGVSVNGSVEGSDSGSLDANRKSTGTDGRVSFTYRTTSSTADGDHAINFTMEDTSSLSGTSFDASTPENVSMEVTVTASGSGGGGAFDVAWTDPSGEDSNSDDSFGTCDADACTWDVGASSDGKLDLNATLAPIFEGVDLEFAVSNSTVGTVSPTSATTDSNGAAIMTLSADENGTVDVLASANDGSDTIRIDVRNVSGGGMQGPSLAVRLDDLTNQSSNEPRYIASYNVSNANTSFERVDVTVNQSNGGSQTFSPSTSRGGVEYTNNYGSGETYDVTYEVIYTDSTGDEYVADSTTVSDTADAVNPSGNEGLANTASRQLTSYTIEDRTNVNGNQPRYSYTYDVSGTGNFQQVRLYALNIPGGGDTGVESSTNRAENNYDIQLDWGANEDYRVGMLVRDTNGTVVDIVSIRDPADGSGNFSGR